MKSSKTIKIVMEMITYISLVLYMFDVVLLGTGELTKSFGIQSRMIFFGISVLAAVVLILLDLKKYLNNKYLISVLVFMVIIFIVYKNNHEMQELIHRFYKKKGWGLQFIEK